VKHVDWKCQCFVVPGWCVHYVLRCIIQISHIARCCQVIISLWHLMQYAHGSPLTYLHIDHLLIMLHTCQCTRFYAGLGGILQCSKMLEFFVFYSANPHCSLPLHIFPWWVLLSLSLVLLSVIFALTVRGDNSLCIHRLNGREDHLNSFLFFPWYVHRSTYTRAPHWACSPAKGMLCLNCFNKPVRA
jgi:hypothetical protein